MAHKSFLFFSALVNSIINGANLMQTAKNGAPDKPCGVGRADANPKLLLNDT